MESHNLQHIRDKLITLAAVNIFQPAEKAFLSKQLDSIIDTERLDYILNELLNEKRVVIEKNHFRVTNRGMKSMIPDKGRILRDIQRMEYLVQLSKERGGI